MPDFSRYLRGNSEASTTPEASRFANLDAAGSLNSCANPEEPGGRPIFMSLPVQTAFGPPRACFLTLQATSTAPLSTAEQPMAVLVAPTVAAWFTSFRRPRMAGI